MSLANIFIAVLAAKDQAEIFGNPAYSIEAAFVIILVAFFALALILAQRDVVFTSIVGGSGLDGV